MRSKPLPFLVLLVVMALSQQASANAGTPLMWAEMLHLVIGNAFIGIGEGILLAWLFSVPKLKSSPLMIAANYVSAWIGGVFLGGSIVRHLPLDLNNAWMWFWIMVGVTFCMTLILEWPFIAWCFRGKTDWFWRSVRATLVTQSVSYVLVFGWYWVASGTSLYTQMNIVSPDELSLPESVIVYFIAPADGNVYRRELPAGGAQKVFDLHSTDKNDRLFVRPGESDTSRWDVVARLDTEDYNEPRLVNVLTNRQGDAAPDRLATRTDPPRYAGTWFNFGKAPSLGCDGSWEFYAGFWPIEGLRAECKSTGKTVRFSYETPFGAWSVRNAVRLPTDKVLFQLGEDQICGFDPVSRRVALLWRGRGAVPVIEKADAGGERSPK